MRVLLGAASLALRAKMPDQARTISGSPCRAPRYTAGGARTVRLLRRSCRCWKPSGVGLRRTESRWSNCSRIFGGSRFPELG